MRQPSLRVYFGPDDGGETRRVEFEGESKDQETVTISLADLMPALLDAARNGRTWLFDFSDDEITISADLYDVLLAYQHYRRPSA